MLVRPRKSVSSCWASLVSHWRQQSLLERASAVLVWDQNVMMPTIGGEERAAQLGILAEKVHESKSSAAYGALLDKFHGSNAVDADGQALTQFEQRSVALAMEEFCKGHVVSGDLIARQSSLRSRCQGAWAAAKQRSDTGSFASVQPLLDELVQVSCDIAEVQRQALGKGGTVYDMMLGDYSRGFGSDATSAMFKTFHDRLSCHVKAAAEDVENLLCSEKATFELEKQKTLAQRVVQHVFSKDALCEQVRLDESAHPFSIRVGSQDARITTRYNAKDLRAGMMGTLHECGHALYELGLPKGRREEEEEDITHYPAARYLDVAVHESQSLFWERCVGQSEAFACWLAPRVWQHFSYGRWDPKLQPTMPEAVKRALNAPSRTAIRVDADAMAYPLHVKVRFEIERDLIEGRLRVQDLPQAWDAAYKETLGIVIDNPSHGVLQDVHFYAGMFGYFPSYTKGAILAFQLWQQCIESLGGEQQAYNIIASGEWHPISGWLHDNVHQYGYMDDNALNMYARISGTPCEQLQVDEYCTYLIKQHGLAQE